MEPKHYIIQSLLKDGKTYREIGELTNLSRQRIFQIAKKHGINPIRRIPWEALPPYFCLKCGQRFDPTRVEQMYCGMSCAKLGKKRPYQKERKVGWSNGYKYIVVNGKKLFEHREVMKEAIGRKIDGHEVVHHVNGIRSDNVITNLRLMTRSEHTRLHHAMKQNVDKNSVR